MPSSTSSFDRATEGPWIRTWILAALLMAAGLGGLEWKLRDEGFDPSAKHDKTLWAIQRHALTLPGKTPLAVVGSSRVSSGFDPDVFEDAYPDYRVSMLAKAGSSGAATLEDLADDPSFSGVVILSMFPQHMLRKNRKEQRAMARHYHEVTENYAYIDKFLNRRAEAAFSDTFAFRNPRINLWPWVRSKLTDEPPAKSSGVAAKGDKAKDKPPTPNYMRAHGDYSRSPDYSKIDDLDAHRRKRHNKARSKYRKAKIPKPKGFLRQSKYIEEAIGKIIDRGGKVVVVRYITCGSFRKLNEKFYPRAKYWDAFAKRTRATMIHFEDHETLSGYACPDGSHIDASDSARYTKALADVMAELDVISN